MRIDIDDKRKILAVQEAFTKMFPYLKIEFICKHAKPGDHSYKKIKHPEEMIGTCRTRHNSGVLTITPQTTVSALVGTLKDTYDLTAQILRHSGKAWLETSRTDYWTLEQQNKLGEELSKGN